MVLRLKCTCSGRLKTAIDERKKYGSGHRHHNDSGCYKYCSECHCNGCNIQIDRYKEIVITGVKR